MTQGIYILRHRATGREYVGSAVNVERRIAHHLYLLRAGRHYSAALQNAWRAHPDCFDAECIEVVEDRNFLTAREQFWIWRTEAYGRGYNGTPVASSQAGYRHTAEARAKMRAAKAGKPSTRRGAVLTVEQREKLRAARTGATQPREAVERTASAHRGRKRSAETVARISAGVRAAAAKRRERAQ